MRERENMSIKELQTVYHGFIRPTGEFACDDGLPFLELRLRCRSAFRVYMCLSLSLSCVFRDTELNAFICVSRVNISPGCLIVIDRFISLRGLRRQG